MSRVIALLLLAAGLLVAVPASASADEALAEIARPAPLASYGGWSAWSATDAGGRYVLQLRTPEGVVRPAPYPSSSRPWDVSLGPDTDGRPVAVVRRCTARGCDLQKLDVAAGRAEKLSVSSPSFDEATPAIWRSTVVFTRRVRGCDVPYVKDLRSSAPSRRLLRFRCLQTAPGQASIRGTRILISSVDRSEADANGAGPKRSEIRRYSSREAGSAVLARTSFGEESNLFGQVAQDAGRFAFTVRIGIHDANVFVRIPLAGGRPQESRAFRTLTAGFARTPELGWMYTELPEIAGCSDFDAVPCRIVVSPADPFGSTVRALTPELTVGYTGTPRAGQPLAFSGRLTRRLVAGGEELRVDPVAGVSVDLRQRVGQRPERFVGTGLTATTVADGSWAITLPALTGPPWYTAVAATPGVVTWAGRGTVGSTTP